VARHGGLPVAALFIGLEVAGLAMMAASASAHLAIAGAAVTGFGFAMVFPALGVLVIERVPPQSRGTALSTFALFIDVALCLTGPLAGALAQHSTYAAPFAAAMVSAALALAMVLLMLRFKRAI
jgi:MFS family permease